MAMLLFVGSVNAKPVDAGKARRVAETWMTAMGMKNVSALQNITEQTPFTEFYVFAASQGGFVLVSADDCVIPVLGYSVSGTFVAKEMPAHVRDFFEDYEQEIRYWKQREVHRSALGMEHSGDASQWAMLTAGEMPPALLTTAVSPLMTTTWGQQPWYNDLCPYDTLGDARTVTGCVATATSQIMKYHNHPATGYGSHSYHAFNDSSDYGTLSANFGNTTYQWSSMPDALSSTSSTAQVNAVATLMYHVGVADEMHYNIGSRGGSGANNYNLSGTLQRSSQSSLQAYFKYRPDMVVFGRSDYSDADYCALLRAELDQQRPILYSGRDYAGGHSFVLHGYDNNGLFYVNWGWRGGYDGYYAIGALNPGEGGDGGNATYTFNEANVVVTGIRPNTNWSSTGTTTVAATINGGVGGTLYGTGTYNFGDTIPLYVSVNEGYRFAGWSDGDRENPREMFANGGSYSFTANVVRLQGDTLGYCAPNCRNMTRYSVNYDDNRWGIRLPASSLPVGHSLTSAVLYVYEPGTYTLQVYTGTTAPTTLAASSATVYIDSDQAKQWNTFTLTTPLTVDSTQNLWITFVCPDADYPATVTYWSGNNDGFLFGDDMYSYSNKCSFMINALFSEPVSCATSITTFPYSEGFEGTNICWTAIDNNNDGYTWETGNNVSVTAHTGNGLASSYSWRGNNALYADEYLVSPPITLPANMSATLSWWFRVNGSFPEDRLAVKVSTTGNAASDFTTTLYDIIPMAVHDNWTQQSVRLSAYAGQTIYLAFHHHDSYDMNYLLVDDIEITTAARTYYTLTALSADATMGSVIGAPTAPVPEDTVVTLTAVPNSGYHFEVWSNGEVSSTINVAVNSDTTLIAYFAADIAGYTITATSVNTSRGSVTGGGSYAMGDTAILTAIPNAGYQFTTWADGVIDNPRAVVVTSDSGFIANFTNQRPVAVGDTISHCGNDEFYNTMGAGGNIYWGIMLPSTSLTGRNYLKSVMLYVAYAGTYDLSVYLGGTDSLGTLAHTQTIVFGTDQIGWQEVLLDATVALGGQNLWITLHNQGISYPATACYYVGGDGSDWVSVDGTSWNRIAADYGFPISWMIKAVTSVTQPALPAPTVFVDGPNQIPVSQPSLFTATYTDGASLTWSLPGATPSIATGDSVVASWSAAGLYNVVATATNAYGNSSDTLAVRVVDYTVGDTFSYVLDRPFYTNVGTGTSGAFSWGIMIPSEYMANRRQVTSILAGLKEVGTYIVRLYQGGDNAPQTLVYTDSIAVTVADTAQMYYNYILPTPLSVNTSSNLWVVFYAEGLGYPAKCTHHISDINSDWTSLDGITWYNLPQLGVNASWMIKVVTSSSTPVSYTITATSADASMGSVTGGGTYNAGSTVTLTAIANSGYHFTAWQDGNTQNPRTVTVTGNATYTAYFAANGAPTSCDVTSLPWSYSFINDSISDCWTNIDADGDGLPWMYFANYGAVSFSYISSGGTNYSLTPDNWLISPRVTLPSNGADFHYTYMNLAANYPDHIGVFVSTTDTNPSSFTLLEQYTAVPADTAWQTRTVSLAAYANQQVYIAIRHYNSDDMYAFIVGSVSVTAGSAPVQQYTITALSDNPAMGTVTGGGTYNAGSTAVLTAIPNSGYRFTGWQDGNVQNPRSITVTGNATYTAFFESNTNGDTISYCGNSAVVTAINAGGSPFNWAVMFPASTLTGRNYLKSVMAFVVTDETYTVSIYRGGDTAPANLVHTQTATFDTSHLGWQEIVLDATVSLPTGQNLWVVLTSTAAAVCNHTGDVNSDWLGMGTSWVHLYEANANLYYSWMIKAVTSATAPDLPAPTVAIYGYDQVAVGSTATFEAVGTADAVITWNLQGATPAVATGTTATTTWIAPGYYNVIATITNSHGTSRDTLVVHVVDYAAGDTVSYCLDRDFVTTVGTGAANAITWGIMIPATYLRHRDLIEKVLLYTAEAGEYTMRIYQGGDTVPATLVTSQTFAVTDTTRGYKTLVPTTPIVIDKEQNLWVVFHTDNLAYPAAACAYMGDGNSNWVSLNDSVWHNINDYGLDVSWLIKVVTSAAAPLYHTVTVVSVMNDGSELDANLCYVTGAGSYADGSSVSLAAGTNTSDVDFLYWINVAGDTIVANPYNFTITSDVNLIAVFGSNQGIGDVSGNKLISVYPNPATSFVTIDGIEGQTKVSVVDINGRIVLTQTLTSSATQSLTLDVSTLSAGTYFVSVGNAVRKLIINR